MLALAGMPRAPQWGGGSTGWGRWICRLWKAAPLGAVRQPWRRRFPPLPADRRRSDCTHLPASAHAGADAGRFDSWARPSSATPFLAWMAQWLALAIPLGAPAPCWAVAVAWDRARHTHSPPSTLRQQSCSGLPTYVFAFSPALLLGGKALLRWGKRQPTTTLAPAAGAPAGPSASYNPCASRCEPNPADPSPGVRFRPWARGAHAHWLACGPLYW